MLIPNTTTTATQLLLNNISQYSLNPSSIQQDILNVLELCLNGYDIVDATNPFIFLMEASATCTAAAISASESSVRKQYPLLAQTASDLYNHMSDNDFVGIYATGATGTVEIMLPYSQVLTNGVYLNNSTNVQTVTIPRDTQISVNGINLGINYPININVLEGTIVETVYDTTITSPLAKVSANLLVNTTIIYQNTKYLKITVPVTQYTNASYIYPINPITNFSKTITFSNTDSYYYTRVYINNGNNKWTEVQTTYSPFVYDISIVTFLLSVVDNTLTVTLPTIYQTNNIGGTSVRIDLFTCIGVLDVDLSQVAISSFSAKWQDFDTLNPNPGTIPLSSINDIYIFATDVLTGGSNASTLEQIRQNVIYHTNSTVAPVRLTDVNIGLSKLGYSVQKIIDSVTDRVFIASKGLPNIINNGLNITPLITNFIVSFNLSGGLIGGGYTQSLIVQNNSRTTITPNTIYNNVNGNVTILSDSQLTTLNSLTPTQLVNTLNTNYYYYSPFHYIIDYTQSVLTVRPYYLQNPIVYGSNSIAFNTVRNYNISTLTSNITLSGNQYILTLTASVPSNITGVICQLAYVDAVSGTTLYLNTSSSSVGANGAYFTFTLNTTFDVNQNNQLEITGMMNTLNSSASVYVDLEAVFNVFYLVTGSNTGLTTTFDNLYFISSGMPSVIGATYETITTNFGSYLANLYCYNTEILSPLNYQTYSTKVYATYTENVYATDTNGNYEFTVNTTTAVNSGSFISGIVYKIATLGTTSWGSIGWTTANSETYISTPAIGDWFIATGPGISGTGGIANTGVINYTVLHNIGDPIYTGATVNNTTNGSTASGSNTIVLNSATGFVQNMNISGNNYIQPGTTISSVTGNTLTLSLPTTGIIPTNTTIIGGIQIVLHNVGDTIFDSFGNPVPIVGSINSTLYNVGITMLDARYKLYPSIASTAAATETYINSIPGTIVGYLNNEIIPAAGQLNERTELYYTPPGEIFQLSVYTGSGVIALVPSVLSIQITYYVTPSTLTDSTILDNIKTVTRGILSNIINQSLLSTSVLTTNIQNIMPNGVVSFEINSFLPNGLNQVTLVDTSKSFNIQQIMVINPDGTLDVIDNVVFTFVSSI